MILKKKIHIHVSQCLVVVDNIFLVAFQLVQKLFCGRKCFSEMQVLVF